VPTSKVVISKLLTFKNSFCTIEDQPQQKVIRKLNLNPHFICLPFAPVEVVVAFAFVTKVDETNSNVHIELPQHAQPDVKREQLIYIKVFLPIVLSIDTRL